MMCEICGTDNQFRINRDDIIHDFQLYCKNCYTRWLFPGLIIEWDLSRIEELIEAYLK